MSSDMVRAQRQRKQARKRKVGEHALDHENPEAGGADLARTVEQEKAELQHRDKAKQEFRQR